MPNIVVIGAGISGLTCSLLLSKNPKYKVTVVAKHMPGDYDIEYASPWAGANYLPVSSASDSRWERDTWPELARLAEHVPEAGIHFQEAIIYTRVKDIASATNVPGPTGKWFNELLSPTPWFNTLVPKFRVLSKEEIPPFADAGTAYMSVCINTAVYLPWLVSECLKKGVIFKRAILVDIMDSVGLCQMGKADFVVNCTGLGARNLGGVMDKNVVPVRGQIVVVRNTSDKMYTVSGTDDDPEDVSYIMERAAGGGTVLGGTYQKGNWESQPDPNTAIAIMKRAVELNPSLILPDPTLPCTTHTSSSSTPISKLSVIRHAVGLRPVREGGVRIETEIVDVPGKENEGKGGKVGGGKVGGVKGKVAIVHNYGHGGWGYQASYGCARGVVELVDAVFEKGTSSKLTVKAKL